MLISARRLGSLFRRELCGPRVTALATEPLRLLGGEIAPLLDLADADIDYQLVELVRVAEAALAFRSARHFAESPDSSK